MKHTIPPYYERVKNLNDYQDYFGRADFRDNLIRLLSNTEDSLVISLNADWGEGKTTFIKFWERELKRNDNFIPIYYDAFENDFTSDVFISIAVTIQKALMKHYDTEKSEFDDYKDLAIELGVELAKMTISNAVTIKSAGLLSADSFMDWATGKYKKRRERNKKVEIRGSKEFLESKYDAFFDKKELLKNYHDKIKLLLNNDENGQAKIIFMVDELDRCRPSFAIEVIEKIKHLFSIKNVNFILAINREQLVKIIRSAYGVEDEDAFTYLQKFVHIETTLPSLKSLRKHGKRNEINFFVTDLVEAFQIPNNYKDSDLFTDLLIKLLSKVDLTPRSVERTLTLYTISISSVSEQQSDRLWKQIYLLSALKAEVPVLFEQIKSEGQIRNSRTKDPISYGNFVEWLQDNYFNEGEISLNESKSPKVAEITGFEEALRIVDIYELPKSSIKIKDSISIKDNIKKDS